MATLADFADTLLQRIRELVPALADWTNIEKLMSLVASSGVLMIGIKGALLDKQEAITRVLATIKDDTELTADNVHYLQHEFGLTGLAALVEIDWKSGLAEKQAERMEAVKKLLGLFNAGIEIARAW